MQFQSITLDLDGTLVDSALDLTLACQAMLAELGEPDTSEMEIRSFVGEGMANLVSRCLSRSSVTPVDEARLQLGIAAFRKHYRRLNGQAATLYPGVLDALMHWQNAGVPMACVTNKPMEFTQPLLERLGLASFFAVVVGGDTCAHKKPHPEPIRYACQQMGTAPKKTCILATLGTTLLLRVLQVQLPVVFRMATTEVSRFWRMNVMYFTHA